MARLIAIAIIWVGCAAAWLILGSNLVWRTQEVTGPIVDEVHALWGPPGHQVPPSGMFQVPEATQEKTTTRSGEGASVEKVVERLQYVARSVTLEQSRVSVAFALQHRKKGLLWFPTYDVDFDAEYTFQNPTDAIQEVTLRFPLQPGTSPDPAFLDGRSDAPVGTRVSFDDFKVLDADGRPVEYEMEGGVAVWKERFGPNEARRYSVAYRTRGTSSWRYDMAQGSGRVRNLEVTMRTDFENVDFPPGTTSPTEHATTGGGWEGHWRFESLIAGAPIGIGMPQLLNPGPLASKVTFFAPLSLLFYFFVVAILAAVQRRELHPMHYLLLGCAFFAFHLLFAYLVDHLAILPAFCLASVVSLLLGVSYARLFVGWRFALREMGFSQLIYLVLFSYTFFWEGFTGLTITIGAILTLFVVMQITGRVNWNEALARRRLGSQPGAGASAAPATVP